MLFGPATNPAPVPPMLESVASLTAMGVQTLPVEYRDSMRALIRQTCAVAWAEGRAAGVADTIADRPATSVEEAMARHPAGKHRAAEYFTAPVADLAETSRILHGHLRAVPAPGDPA